MVTFYTFFHHEENGFSMSMKKNSGLVVIGILKENQLKDKYVTNQRKKCNKKKDIVTFLSNDMKVRGSYEH